MKIPAFISRLRSWLNDIPIHDVIDRRMAALLQAVLIGFASILVIATVINLLLAPPTLSRQEILINNAVFLFVVWIPFFLLRRGYYGGSIFIVIFIFVGLETYNIFYTADLRSRAETLSLFTLAILLAGLLSGRKALAVTFALSSIVIIAWVFMTRDIDARLDGISIAGNFILVNGLLSIFLGRFDLALRTALKNALDRENDLKGEIAIRARIQAEREKLIEQLEMNNAELERFSYTVSHDLRTPLVTIKGFLGMLNKDIVDDKPDRIRHDMERIANATDKMDNLLSELLELSRIGRIINPPEEIAFNQLVQEAIELLDAKIRASNVKITVMDELPVLYGDRIRLLEVFENLISNAIKYMGDQSDPLVEIGVRNTAGQQVIFVRDNGIGIDERYHVRVFGLFEKLDPTVEGTGIGLALVKRIVETHGGWVWIESEGVGKGTTFCFTLPDERK